MEESCPATPLVLTGRDSKSPLQISISSPESDEMKSPSRNSPDSHCVICLGRLQNKSFTDSCLHQFCFQCLLQWSKVKAECPLCKQPFKSIIHNVRSNFDYDQYHVGQPHCVLSDLVHTYNFDFIPVEGRFRYRSTMTREYFRELAETFLAHTRRMPDNDSYEIPPMMPVDPAPGSNVRRSSRLSSNSMPQRARQRGTSEFRRNIYIQDLWVEDLADVSGRYRTCTPQFYRDNPAQIHRIIPWLNREVNVLLNDCGSHAAYVLSQIVAILPLHSITSTEFRELVEPYFGQRTEHFIHELYTFARSVYDIAGFDQNAVYAPNPNYATEVQEISSSSSSSDDSDIEILETVESDDSGSRRQPRKGFKKNLLKRAEQEVKPNEPVAGPSGLSNAGKLNSVDIYESDSDDVKILNYVKPEPEVVILSSGEDAPVYSDLDSSEGEYAETIRCAPPKVNQSSESTNERSAERDKCKAKSGKGKCKSNGFGLKGKQKKNYMRSRKSRSPSSGSNKSIISNRSSSRGSRQGNTSRSRSRSRSSSSFSSISSTSVSSTTISSSSSSSSTHTVSSVERTYPRRSKRVRSNSSDTRNQSECKQSGKVNKKSPKESGSNKKSKENANCDSTVSKAKRHRSCDNSGNESDKKAESKRKIKSCVVVPKIKPCDLSYSSLNSSKCGVSGSRNSEESEPRKRSRPLTSYWSIALDTKKRDKSRNRRENSSRKKKGSKSKGSSNKSCGNERSSKRSKEGNGSSNKSTCDGENSTNQKKQKSSSEEDGNRESSNTSERVDGQNTPSVNETPKTAFLATSPSSVSRSPEVSFSPENAEQGSA